MNESPDRTESIFAAAVALTSSDERASFLLTACAGDTVLQARIEALLRAHDRAGHLLDRPVPGGHDLTQALPTADNPGTLIAGHYKLLEAIGEGGMGSVWVAEQKEPVKRKVAIKLIKAGMDSKSVLARFEAERQALAMMDHPNIAKVFDGGVTDQGRPFFVMEYVRGVALTDYCDQARLSLKERLNLFMTVCQAVQHAHQKGIIHRDLKPSNILICLYDGKPVPKVIDFGLAKAMHQSLTEQSLFTAHGMMVGTPLYMSPEQAEHNNLDVDTRTDIYSLGVILYELLTGSTLLERQQMKAAAFNEILRLIKDVEPPKPSTRLSSSQNLPSIAAQRSIEPNQLKKSLIGDLDWIVMKALDKERSRRYETANGLSRDVERFLNDEAVEACPPSTVYRLKKFIHRNRPQVMAASLVLLALLAGIVGTSVGLYQANLARMAEAQQRKMAEAKEQEANQQRAKALAAADEERKAKVREAERAEGERQAKLDAEAKKTEAERARVRAETEKKRADEEKQIAQAVKDFLQTKLLAQADTTVQANQLLRAGGLAGDAKLNPTIRELLDRAARELTPDRIEANFPNQPLVQAEILQTVGDTYRGVGEAATGIPFLARSLDLFKAQLGPDHPDTLISMSNLATGYQAVGQLDQALPLYEETLRLKKAQLGPEHPETLHSMNNLASGYWAAGKLNPALPLLEETLKLMKAKLGPDHPKTLFSMSNLAMGYQDAGKLDLALPLFEETLKLRKAQLGSEHPDTLNSMNNLATGYWGLKQLDKSVPLLEQLLPLQEKKLGRQHPKTQMMVGNLGVNYKDAGRLKEAIPLLEEAYRGSKKTPTEGLFARQLLDAYAKAGKTTEARKLIDVLLADARKQLPKDSPQLAGQLAQFGMSVLEMKGYTEAELLLRECLAVREQKEPDAWTTFNTQSMLGGALLGQKKYADAEPLLLAGYEGLKERETTIPEQGKIRLTEALERLVQLYTDWHAAEPDKGYEAKAAEWQTKLDQHKAAMATEEPASTSGK